MDFAEKGRLQYGVQFDGKWHYDFEVRIPTVKDNIIAVEQYGTLSGIRVSFAMMVACINYLGDIPKEKLTLDFLMDGIVDADFDALEQAIIRAKKKRELQHPDLKAITPPASSLAVTE
ncbi:hypothetical protein [Oligella urethralis]|uniref:hypothetical protein n=1 Tax=Oligella urethralis TaxID=90245 RepID=UPI002889071A|nr:hypothetical protein [Oligella urethralis]